MKYISIETILSEIREDISSSTLSDDTVYRLLTDGLRRIGAVNIGSSQVAMLEVSDHVADIPNEVVIINELTFLHNENIKVKDGDFTNQETLSSFYHTYVSDNSLQRIHYSTSKVFNLDTTIPTRNNSNRLKFMEELGVLKFNFLEGNVLLFYKGYYTDKNGALLIPDYVEIKDYLHDIVTTKLYATLALKNPNNRVFHITKREMENGLVQKLKKAQSIMMTPKGDKEYEAISNILLKDIKTPQHETFNREGGVSNRQLGSGRILIPFNYHNGY